MSLAAYNIERKNVATVDDSLNTVLNGKTEANGVDVSATMQFFDGLNVLASYSYLDAEIIKAPTVLLGTGEAISGRIIMQSGYSPAENLIFYGTETLSTGWSLISSKVGEEVTLVYSKSGRFATIYISPRNTVGGFISGDYGSDIDISVVHPNAIDIQNPYKNLDYDSLPESP